MPPPCSDVEGRYPRTERVSPDYSDHPSGVPCPLPRRIERVLMSITSPLARPSPNGRRVGIRIVTFEACSGFTRVTARRIAQLPKATFVTRLQPLRLPARAARQLPDQSTTLWVESSSTSDVRLRGALPIADLPGSIRVFAGDPTNQSSRHFEPMRQPSEGTVVLYRPCLEPISKLPTAVDRITMSND